MTEQQKEQKDYRDGVAACKRGHKAEKNRSEDYLRGYAEQSQAIAIASAFWTS